MKRQIFRNLWVLLAFFLLLAPSGVQAQKKEIVAAKDLVKAGKDLAKAESSMRKLDGFCQSEKQEDLEHSLRCCKEAV